MSNTYLGKEVASKVEADDLLWSGWQGYCCTQGAQSRSCRVIRTADLGTCNDAGRLGLLCRAAYHCSGADCFCCSNAIDAACDMLAVPPPVLEEYETKRRVGTVWSPY